MTKEELEEILGFCETEEDRMMVFAKYFIPQYSVPTEESAEAEIYLDLMKAVQVELKRINLTFDSLRVKEWMTKCGFINKHAITIKGLKTLLSKLQTLPKQI